MKHASASAGPSLPWASEQLTAMVASLKDYNKEDGTFFGCTTDLVAHTVRPWHGKIGTGCPSLI